MKKQFLHLILIIVALASAAPLAYAKKSKTDEKKEVTVKVWFKDGSVYEGPMVKHWCTYRQMFLGSGHNFHTLPDPTAKSVKHEAADTDSILIVSSSSEQLNAGELYVSFSGLTPMMGGKRKCNKMLFRARQGRNVEMCRLPYMGNCQVGMRNDDQRLVYWMIRFPQTGDAVAFYINTLQKGCTKPRAIIDYFVERVEKFDPGLAKAVKAKFSPDKKTRKEMNKTLLENPDLFVDFVDNYLTENP